MSNETKGATFPMFDETVADIKEELDYCEKEGKLRPFTFFFCDPEDNDYAFWENEALGLPNQVKEKSESVSLAIRIFQDLGCELDYGDTVDFSFSLNRCWWSATYDRCFRSYGFTLPASDDTEALAKLVHYVAKGKLQMIVMKA